MVTYKYAKADLSSPIDSAALASLPAFFRERIGKKKNPEAKAESFLGAKILMELLSKCGISPDTLEFKTDENGRAMMQIDVKCKNLLRTLPLLMHDTRRQGDAATEPHEITHAPDALRYFASFRVCNAGTEAQKSFLRGKIKNY